MADERSRWEAPCGIITHEQMKDLFTSTLVINVSQGQVIKLLAGPLKIYSVDLLKTRMHGQETILKTGRPDAIRYDGAAITINSFHSQYNDPLDHLQVIRPSSPIFSKFMDSTKGNVMELLRFCMSEGEVDNSRRNPKMHRVMSIGVKAEIQSLNEPINIYGSKSFRQMSV